MNANFNITKQDLLKTMDDLLQDPYTECLYQIEAKGAPYTVYIPFELKSMSYISACDTARCVAKSYKKEPGYTIRVFMCPGGQKAASPVFEIKENGDAILNGVKVEHVEAQLEKDDHAMRLAANDNLGNVADKSAGAFESFEITEVTTELETTDEVYASLNKEDTEKIFTEAGLDPVNPEGDFDDSYAQGEVQYIFSKDGDLDEVLVFPVYLDEDEIGYSNGEDFVSLNEDHPLCSEEFVGKAREALESTKTADTDFEM